MPIKTFQQIQLPNDPAAVLQAGTKQYIDAADAAAIPESQVTNLVTDLAGKQPIDTDLTAIAGLTPSADDVMQYKSGAWANRTLVQLKTDLAISASPVNYDFEMFADIAALGRRWDATSTIGWSASFRTINTLVAKVPNGTVVTGFRFIKTTAASGGTPSASLFTSSTLGATSWARVAAGLVAPTMTGTGLVSVPCGFTASGDTWVRLVMTYTATATTYPQVAGFTGVFGAPAAAVATLANGHQLAGTSATATAPGTTMDPSTGWTVASTIPWVALY